MEKIRAWLLTKINVFKKPFTNYQVTQDALLKNRYDSSDIVFKKLKFDG